MYVTSSPLFPKKHKVDTHLDTKGSTSNNNSTNLNTRVMSYLTKHDVLIQTWLSIPVVKFSTDARILFPLD